jgi:hypothetical protein
MLPASFSSILQKIASGEYGVNPTIIYNEGWMLRLLLHYHYSGVNCFPFSHDEKAKWFSDVQLQTAFNARFNGDQISENRTEVDGAYGHIRNRKRSGLRLEKDATQFIVLEAKIYSPLSSGIRRSPGFDQVARTVACMAKTIEDSRLSVNKVKDLGFYVVAPLDQILRGVFAEYMKTLNINDKVEARIEQYADDSEAYEKLLTWKKRYFEPVLNRIQLRSISWEETIERLTLISPEKATVREFYAKCLEYNK